jgi:hypothetical protein
VELVREAAYKIRIKILKKILWCVENKRACNNCNKLTNSFVGQVTNGLGPYVTCRLPAGHAVYIIANGGLEVIKPVCRTYEAINQAF